MSAIQQLLTDHIDIWTAAETEKKSGRGRASGNAGSVYGIKKLRELILELAVRGKLVPQDVNDEPASELLKRIQAEKAKLIAEGNIKKDKPLAAITEDEKPFELPKGWEWVRFADLVNVLNGRAYKKEELIDAGTPVLRVGNLFTSEHWYYSDLILEEDKYCNKGDLLFAWSASFGPFIWDGDKAIYHYHIWKLDLYGGDLLYKRYLYTFLLEQTQKIKAAGHGVMMIHMTKEKMEKIVVYLPPLAEQHRIAAKVDELMALCDQLENQHSNAADAHEKLVSHLLGTLTQSQSAEDFSANWQRIAAYFDTLFTTDASIDALKQTLLQLAVMGKLVPQDVNEEPASELLKRIHAEKVKLIAEGKMKKDKPLPPITDDEKPFELPNTWQWVKLQEVFDVRDGTHDTPKYCDIGFPLITSKNISTGILDFSDIKYISEADHLKIKDRSAVKRGDILFAMIGSIGNPVIVNIDTDFSIKNMALFKPYSNNICDMNYLLKYLLIAAVAMREQSTGAVQSFVSLGIIRNYLYAMPPLAEQHRIIAKVDELMGLCDQLKSRITDASRLQQKLADVLVEQAVA
ncbi:restriction endonuclease subunit S [Gallionella capsiferriformans]|jgi:type I restriction enzyme S subunit|uniref:Restriction modification system DNA specificity domain n=1 Tax=Gallionella capsiferriformans (strain ES-2) TaxID=395494 RepID=D9SE88_GALCS|nr:restriction endonuclease subunit S [Gallionella capsiferriformans]ADL56910.1 restriction modification system DNA specificity domain [Gallionella capsiferriformans ES-2]